MSQADSHNIPYLPYIFSFYADARGPDPQHRPEQAAVQVRGAREASPVSDLISMQNMGLLTMLSSFRGHNGLRGHQNNNFHIIKDEEPLFDAVLQGGAGGLK